MEQNEKERRDALRLMIPRTKKLNPKTTRLDKLDSMLMSQQFSMEELNFIEQEIKLAREKWDCDEEDEEEETL